ncbi:lysophospholipid acyltransferase family protein [Pedobacter sp. BS3]|uniref:lysophospholipid acyltransferase family protein n=1 Tax=Pedobacter sp. BS3 TaxID=2567937 RepID=UPI0011EE3F34|nr:lysophospholipid acyltransferase family protein [Pedobacter sp. BS3]TZF83827.1 lysophospholipid acyltransferase family protein [Pedobacter sp. BS3]
MRKSLSGIISFFLYLASLLPFRALYVLADITYVLIYYIVGYRRQVVKINLQNAFPEKSVAERKAIEKKFYRFLSDQAFEILKMRSVSPACIKKRFVLNNLDELRQHLDAGRAVIGATGHYANWEWGTLIISLAIDNPIIVVYKPIQNQGFETYMNRMRARFGAHLVAMKRTLRKIVEFKGQPFLALLVSDQTPVQGETQYYTRFLNQPTAVFLGVEKIARLNNSPVVFCHIDRLKRGYYNCTFKTLVADSAQTAPHEITELHTRELERIIRQKPELWLWSHRRWKFKPKEETAQS